MAPSHPSSVFREQRSFYRGDIDGLRAVAIVAVVLFHAAVPGFSGGFVGVDIFFVISGLLVGAHVYEDVKAGRFRLGLFYTRRAKRLLPALFVVILTCNLLAVLLLSPAELVLYGKYSIATALSGANLFAWRVANYFAPEASQNPLLSAWSLSMEEQFYWFFPLIVLLCSRASRRSMFFGTTLIAIISAACCVAATDHHLAASFNLLPFRAWEFCAGFLLALTESRRGHTGSLHSRFVAEALSIFGIAAILWSVYGFSVATVFPGYATFLPVAGASALLMASRSSLNRYILASAPLAVIGRLSYSIYLWHWPLLSFVHIVSDRPLSVTVEIATEAVAAGLAVLSYLFVEEPFRRSTRSARSLGPRYLALSAAMTIPGVLFVAYSGFPQRDAAVAQIDRAMAAGDHACWSETSDVNFGPDCINLQDAKPAIALLGDSHAEALAEELRAKAKRSGYKLYELVKSSCPPLQGVTTYHFAVSKQVECELYNHNAIEFLTHTSRVKMAIIAGYWSGPLIDHDGYIEDATLHVIPTHARSLENLSAGLQAEVASLQASKIKVVLLRDVPHFRFSPASRLRANATPFRRLLVGRMYPEMLGGASSAPYSDTFVQDDAEVEQVIDSVVGKTGATVFDPKPNLCVSGRCQFAVSSAPLYLDQHHLTNLGSAYALRSFDINPVSGPKGTLILQ